MHFGIGSGLIAVAVRPSKAVKPIPMWREQCPWMVGQCVVLCISGLLLSVAYTDLGPLCVIVLALLVFIMHFAQ